MWTILFNHAILGWSACGPIDYLVCSPTWSGPSNNCLSKSFLYVVTHIFIGNSLFIEEGLWCEEIFIFGGGRGGGVREVHLISRWVRDGWMTLRSLRRRNSVTNLKALISSYSLYWCLNLSNLESLRKRCIPLTIFETPQKIKGVPLVKFCFNRAKKQG